MCARHDHPPYDTPDTISTLGEAVEAGVVTPDVDFPVDWSGDMPWEEAQRKMNAGILNEPTLIDHVFGDVGRE